MAGHRVEGVVSRKMGVVGHRMGRSGMVSRKMGMAGHRMERSGVVSREPGMAGPRMGREGMVSREPGMAGPRMGREGVVSRRRRSRRLQVSVVVWMTVMVSLSTWLVSVPSWTKVVLCQHHRK